MKNVLRKDILNRVLVNKDETERFVHKGIISNTKIHILMRFLASEGLACMSKKGSPVLLTNRCVETNRRKRINKFYSYSRITFRKLAQRGFFNGLSKSSW